MTSDPPVTEKVPHAPAATIEASQLAEFTAKPARVQQLITAALELTKLNLTYTCGDREVVLGKTFATLPGNPVSARRTELLRVEGGKWKSVDLAKLCETPTHPTDGKGAPT